MKMGSGFGAPAPECLSKNSARADLDLLTGIVLDDLRAILAFGALQSIAPLVVAEGLRIFALILQPLAEREAQVIPVDERGRRRRLPRRACA